MDLTNLTIGQTLYSALNGETTFMGYIDDPNGNTYLVCTAKNNRFFYYFIDGKYYLEGQIVLFCEPIAIGVIHTNNANNKEDRIVGIKDNDSNRITKDIIKDIINMYENVIESPYIDCTDEEQIVEEIWQRLQ